MIFGITGGTGCGKTTALQAIRELGGIIIDCDAVYHVLLQTDKKMLAAIEKRFPGTVVDGVLDRKKLGPIVFSDDQALLDLNAITHNHRGHHRPDGGPDSKTSGTGRHLLRARCSPHPGPEAGKLFPGKMRLCPGK